MDEIDLLAKRFKDFLDKVQSAFDNAESQKPDMARGQNGLTESPVKLYTVVSPVEAMASNLQSVLTAIDKAIDNIDELSHNRNAESNDPLKEISKHDNREGVYIPDPGEKKFTTEELDFLVRTFNKILNTPEEERKRLFRHFEKKGTPS